MFAKMCRLLAKRLFSVSLGSGRAKQTKRLLRGGSLSEERGVANEQSGIHGRSLLRKGSCWF